MTVTCQAEINCSENEGPQEPLLVVVVEEATFHVAKSKGRGLRLIMTLKICDGLQVDREIEFFSPRKQTACDSWNML